MSFEIFFNFIMACIRLEPNLWIKSSEKYKEITKKLREQFGESMGGLEEIPAQQSMNDQKI